MYNPIAVGLQGVPGSSDLCAGESGPKGNIGYPGEKGVSGLAGREGERYSRLLCY